MGNVGQQFFEEGVSEDITGKAVLINRRGSLEQMFCAFMDGPPHHDCCRLTWRANDVLGDAFRFPDHVRLRNLLAQTWWDVVGTC